MQVYFTHITLCDIFLNVLESESKQKKTSSWHWEADMIRCNSCVGYDAENRQDRKDTNYHEKPAKTVLTPSWGCGNIVKVDGWYADRKWEESQDLPYKTLILEN